MRRRLIALLGAAAIAAALLVGAAVAFAQTGVTRTGSAPFCHDIAAGEGDGAGAGSMMSGATWDSMRSMMGFGSQDQSGERIDAVRATTAVQQYLDDQGQADLAVATVTEFERNYYAVIAEKASGKGAMELLVDPWSGAVYPEFGPNMMWNNKFGHMAGGGMMNGAQGMMGSGFGTMGSGMMGPTLRWARG